MENLFSKFILTSFLLLVFACDKSTRQTIVTIDNSDYDFQFGQTTSIEIIEKLGLDLTESRFVPLPEDSMKFTRDDKIKYNKLGLTFELSTHEPNSLEKSEKHTSVLRSIQLDSAGVLIEGLQVGMSKNEIEKVLGPSTIPFAGTDSSYFNYRYINWYFTANKIQGRYIVTSILRNYPKSLEDFQN